MRSPGRALVTGIAFAAAASAAACSPGPSCLAGDDACDGITVCARLGTACAADDALWIGPVGDAPGGPGAPGVIDLVGAEGVAGDLLLQNGRITAVLDALDTPRGLAVSGGSLIDLGPRGGRDALTSMVQLAGVLPEDTFRYDSWRLIDESPRRVAVVLRGALDGRPEVPVVTRIELHACEAGLRVRSELVNRSADPLPLLLADAAHWGKRHTLPFAPQPGQGFLQPELDLVELGDAYFAHPYVAARPAEDRATSYGFVPCDRDTLDGVNDPEISALGTPFALVRPGESLALERFVLASGGSDLDGAVAEIAAVRGRLHGDPPAVEVRGRVVASGLPLGGSLRRAAVLVSEQLGEVRRPLSVVVPGEDGRFRARVAAAGPLELEVWSFGRPVASAAVPGGAASHDAGDLAIDLPARLVASVTGAGGAPIHALLALHPADEPTRAAVTGSWFGRFGACAPWLGPPVGGSPACNRALVPPEGIDLELPAGRYEVWATAGPEHTLALAELTLAAGEVAEIALALEPLAVRPPGMVAADLHVHGRASFDSSLPDRDRVLSFAAAGIDVIAATDHDAIVDYADAVAAAGLAGRVAVMGGLETTGLLPFLDVPGSDIPRVIGHFNFWPLAPDPSAPRGGAPWDERLEPGALFDRMAPLIGPDGVVMLNHPWDEPQFGRDLGYLRAIEFDPRRPIPPAPDGSSNGMLLEAPGGGRRNIDFDVVELQNGAGVEQYLRARVVWAALIGGGHVRAAASSSDSHSLADAQLGYGRTLVAPVAAGAGAGAPFDPATFEPAAFNRALREGRTAGGNGVVVIARIVSGAGARGVSLWPHALSPGDLLEIEVRAPPWIPVTEVRVLSSAAPDGRVVASADELDHPADPLGTAGVVRWTGSIPLAELVAGAGDDWIAIEAGLPLPAVADLDDDGVPDTTDNDGDGVIDERDIEDPDDDGGPLRQPADPLDRSDPRGPMTRVVPGAWPLGFTGPLLIDRDGGGWNPPGLPGDRRAR